MAQIRFRSTTIAAALGPLLAFTTCFPECRKAKPEDVPHGANMLIELNRQKVSRVSGTVFFPRGEPAGDIVVEVYRYFGKPEFPAAIQPPRLTACITGDDGTFSFPDLKAGSYVLRLGTRKSAGVNEMLVPLVVKRFRWPGRRSTLKLRLQLGT